jgi:hypothetical protein
MSSRSRRVVRVGPASSLLLTLAAVVFVAVPPAAAQSPVTPRTATGVIMFEGGYREDDDPNVITFSPTWRAVEFHGAVHVRLELVDGEWVDAGSTYTFIAAEHLGPMKAQPETACTEVNGFGLQQASGPLEPSADSIVLELDPVDGYATLGLSVGHREPTMRGESVTVIASEFPGSGPCTQVGVHVRQGTDLPTLDWSDVICPYGRIEAGGTQVVFRAGACRGAEEFDNVPSKYIYVTALSGRLTLAP